MSIWGFFSNKIPYKLHWVIWPQIMRTYFVSMIFALSPETKHGYFSIYTKISFVGELEEKLLLSWNTKLIHCYPQPHSDIFTYCPKINYNKITIKAMISWWCCPIKHLMSYIILDVKPMLLLRIKCLLTMGIKFEIAFHAV